MTIFDYLILVFGVFALLLCVAVGIINAQENKIKEFDILCKYHVYDYCAEMYIEFLLKEKVKPSKIIKLVKKAFPDFLVIIILNLLVYGCSTCRL